MMLASPKVAAKRPIQRPRSFGANRSPTEVKAVVMISPAPTPWMARKAISQIMSPAAPHSHDPATKMTIPARMNGFRPYRSESFPDHRHQRRRGQHVRGEGPHVEVEVAEILDDARQRDRHDRLVQRRQEHRREHARQHQRLAPDRERHPRGESPFHRLRATAHSHHRSAPLEVVVVVARKGAMTASAAARASPCVFRAMADHGARLPRMRAAATSALMSVRSSPLARARS